MYSEKTGIFRILDANFNRAGEAFRVVEEFARFQLNDRFLCERLKKGRHELQAIRDSLPAEAFLAARDTIADPGTLVATAQEYERTDSQHVVAANLHRAQEALRSLEEYGKIIAPALAPRLEALRYECYTLEKALLTTARAKSRLGTAVIYALLEAAETPVATAARAREYVAAGVDVIQLRVKTLSDRDLLEHASAVRATLRDSATLFILNDRPDLALLVEADGVHVGQDDLPLAQVRRLLGPERLIGVSTHDLDQARAAVLGGADYIGCGPTFPSRTKTFERFPGTAFLAAVAAEISLPAFAIGGIEEANIGEVAAAGFRRAALAGALARADDPALLVAHMKSALAEKDRS